MTSLERLTLAVIKHGLKLSPSELSKKELEAEASYVRRLMEDHSVASIESAILYGMGTFWPFTSGEAWGAADLSKHITKAKANGARFRRAGLIHHDIQSMTEEESR